MPSASLLGRLTFGAGALGMAFVATAGLTAPAQAVAHHRQHPAIVTARHLTARHLGTLRPAGLVQAASTTAPKVSSVVPAQGAPGWLVVLTGRRFTSVTSVTFGGASAAFRVTSSTRLTATVPAAAKSGPVTVTAKAGHGRSSAFTVTPAQTLEPGETLPSADALSSKDGHFTLAMQANGNLVYGVTGAGHALWASRTAGNPGAYLTMLSHGNLVVYSASGAMTLWSSKTSGHGPARLVAQTNGNLIIYEGSRATWAAGSFDGTLRPGESLQPGWSLNSGSGYKLTMQKDGNLVETGPGGATWSTRTSGHAGAILTMRSSGNLVVHLASTLWASKTSGHSGAGLVFQPGGVLAVLYQGKALWASKKAAAPPLVLGQWAGKAGPAAADTHYGYPYPHPPACTDGGACDPDAWAFYRGQCTSWVAYRLNQLNGVAFTNSYGGKGQWGNALNWAPQARSLKISVTATPAVGSIAWYGGTKGAPDGHVAYVEKVNSPTSIVMSEMNYDSDNGFWVHTIAKATGDWPADFIHLADR
jgi:surface antigen